MSLWLPRLWLWETGAKILLPCVIQIQMRKHSWILAWARHSLSSLQTSILHWSSYFSSPFIKSTYKYTFTYLEVFACLSDLCVVSHSAPVLEPWLVTITCGPCELPHSEVGRNAGSARKACTQQLLWATVDCYLNAGHCGASVSEAWITPHTCTSTISV